MDLYSFMHILIYICAHIFIYVYTYMYKYNYMYIYIYAYIYVYIYVFMYNFQTDEIAVCLSRCCNLMCLELRQKKKREKNDFKIDEIA